MGTRRTSGDGRVFLEGEIKKAVFRNIWAGRDVYSGGHRRFSFQALVAPGPSPWTQMAVGVCAGLPCQQWPITASRE